MRFGPFEFDTETGELWSDQGGRHPVGRLSPQPSRLLAHLIERRPHLVTQDEIRELLWPGVAVEFEESLHSCVRKIRAALDDSATAPRYVETVPRRGYRFIGTMHESIVEPVATEDVPATPSGSRRWLGMAVGLLVVVVGLTALSRVTPLPTRVAVMTFEPVAADSALQPNNDLAEAIVRELVRRRGESVEVVGPTTTEAYTGRWRDMIADLGINYVINARETTGDSGPRVLVEIIRATDGAHVWAHYLDELPEGQAARFISAAVK